MNKNLQKVFRQVKSYTPGEQPNNPGMIKLNTNENPYPPPPAVLEAIRQIPPHGLRRYPDPESISLKKTLGEFHNLPAEYFFMGNGSDEILALIFMAFFNAPKPILFPDITYAFYKVWCSLYRIEYKEIPLDENFQINVEEYKNCGGIVIANPNAPTGIPLEAASLRQIIENNPDVIVVIDEAYIDFGGQSMIRYVEQYDNVIVVRTFSKSRSLAGLRVGYAVCQKHLTEVLNAVKHSFNSYTLNYVSQGAAEASVRDRSYFEKSLADIMQTREWFVKELQAKQYTVLPSSANFVFASPSHKDAKTIFHTLKKHNIYVRYFEQERIKHFLRITIGAKDEMEKLLYFL